MRDKLIELLKENIEVRVNLEGEPGIEVNYEECADILLKNGVTIQETAEWKETGRTEFKYDTEIEEKCTRCGRYVYRYSTQPQDEYCPSCGRKMKISETQEGNHAEIR